MPAKKTYPHRSEKEICYHGRCGHPLIHLDEKTNREYIMVRKKGGGRKRLYLEAGRVPVEQREKKSKRPLSAYHKCLSNELEGTKFESKDEFYKRFVESQIACGANVSEETKKKHGIKLKRDKTKKPRVGDWILSRKTKMQGKIISIDKKGYHLKPWSHPIKGTGYGVQFIGLDEDVTIIIERSY